MAPGFLFCGDYSSCGSCYRASAVAEEGRETSKGTEVEFGGSRRSRCLPAAPPSSSREPGLLYFGGVRDATTPEVRRAASGEPEALLFLWTAPAATLLWRRMGPGGFRSFPSAVTGPSKSVRNRRMLRSGVDPALRGLSRGLPHWGPLRPQSYHVDFTEFANLSEKRFTKNTLTICGDCLIFPAL